MDQSMPGFPVHHQLPEFTQTHVHWVGDIVQPSHPLSFPSPPAFNLSQHQGLFKWVSSSHQWPKYWSFSFNISPSNEYSGLISFRMDGLDLLAVQGTLKSLLQHHSSKELILQCQGFFIVQLSHPSSWWYHPAISSSVVPFSSCTQSLPASESFPMSQLFTWGGQSTGVSALALFPPKNIQDWSPLEWTGWISFQSKGLSRVFSNTTVQKHQFFGAQPSKQSNSHIHPWPLEKP